MAKPHEKYYKHRDLIRELLSDYEIKNVENLSNALKDGDDSRYVGSRMGRAPG